MAAQGLSVYQFSPYLDGPGSTEVDILEILATPHVYCVPKELLSIKLTPAMS